MKASMIKRKFIFTLFHFPLVVLLLFTNTSLAYPTASLSSPSNGAVVNYSSSEPCFSWSVASDSTFTNYSIVVSTTPDLPTTRWQYQINNQLVTSACWNGGSGWVSKGSSPPPAPSRLQEGVTYYWKVVGNYYAQTQTHSNINSFTVKVYPSAPTSLKTSVDNNSWLITWSKPDSSVTSYNVVEVNGGTTKTYNGLTTNSYRPTVTGVTQYSIVACNSNGCGAAATQSFNLTAAPSAPSITVTPSDALSSTSNFTVSWSNVGATSYYLEYAGSSTNNFTPTSSWTPRYNGMALQWVEIMNASYLYNEWRVKACNSICSAWVYSRVRAFQPQSVASTTSLITPADGAQVSFVNANPCFQWQPDPLATQIVVVISNTNDFLDHRWQKTLPAGATDVCWNGGMAGGWEKKGVYSTEVPELKEGTAFYWRVTSTMPAGLSFTSTRSFNLANTISLPATIKAENYATMSGVSKQTTTDADGGLNVSVASAGNWMSYTNYSVNIPVTAPYKITYRVASPNAGASLVLKDGVTDSTLDTAAIPNTGGLQTWVNVVEPAVNLRKGMRSFKIFGAVGGFNINWFKIESIPNSSIPVLTSATLISPANVASVSVAAPNPCFQWGTDVFATGYSVYISNTDDFAAQRWVKTVPVGTTKVCWDGGVGWTRDGLFKEDLPTGLTFGLPHYWQVVSITSNGLGYSETRSFIPSNLPSSSEFDFQTQAPSSFKYSMDSSGVPDLGASQNVATTQGNINVSNGAAQYSVKIDLPPAVRNLKPSLALSYNSRNGNSLMGVGWGLSGLSSITRCRTSFAVEGAEAQKSNPRYTNGDRLCLDGQKLVVASSTSAANDATYWATGTEYKTELDSFSRIVSYGTSANGGHNYFKVWTKDGRILTFGAENHSQNSKIYAPNQYAGPINTWALDKVEDAYGNNYIITYEQNNANGEFYPSQIQLGSTGLVVFTYQTRAGQMPWGYDVGNKYQLTKVLDKVTTYFGTTTTTPIKQYDVNYKISATTNRELVDTIRECGYDLNAWKCAKPLVFDWQAGELGFDSTSQTLAFAGFFYDDINNDGYVDIIGEKSVLAWGNANGSFTATGYAASQVIQLIQTRLGKALIRGVARTQGTTKFLDVYLSRVAPSSAMTSELITSVQYDDFLPTLHVADLNNNGLTDLIINGRFWMQQDNASFIGSSMSAGGYWPFDAAEYSYIDVNNDGLLDQTVVRFYGYYQGTGNYNNGLSGYPNTGDSFGGAVINFGRVSSASPQIKMPSAPSYAPNGGYKSNLGFWHSWIDINGDGNPDVLYDDFHTLDLNVVKKWAIKLSTGTQPSSAPPLLTTGIPVVPMDYAPVGQYSFVMDYNKDGLDDFIVFTGDPSGVRNLRVFYGAYINGTLSFVNGGIDPFMGKLDYLTRVVDVPATETINPLRGDINNDGIPDLIIGDQVYLAKQKQPDLINKITDGFGATTELTYSPLTSDTNNGSPLYTPDVTAPVFPQKPINRSMQVVKKVSASNGQGGFNYLYFNYTGGVQDIFRGFNGFKSITTTNTANNVISTTEYRQGWPYSGLVKKQTVKDTSNKLISITDNNYSLHPQNARFPYLQYSLQKNYDLSTTSESSPISVSKSVNTFDTCGNLVDQITKIGSGFNGNDVTGELINQHVINGYEYYGTSYCNDDFLTGTTQEVSKAGNVDLKRVLTEFIPNAQHDIKTRTDFKGESIQKITTYDRESNGVVNTITSVAKDINGGDAPARITSLSNFAYGMYPQTIINAESHQTSITYDYRFGSVKTKTFIGLTTTNTYDALGRLQTQQAPDGSLTESITFYCTSSPVTCPNGAYYGVATQITNTIKPGKLGEPLSIVFYDNLQREVRNVVYSLDGNVVNRASQYFANGFLSRVSEPYVTTNILADVFLATAWTNYNTYDALGRANSISNADGGSKTTTYAADSYGLKVTDNLWVVKPGGNSETQTSSRIINPLGQVVKVEDALYNTVAYGYDSAGNLETTQVNNNVATKIDLTYDLAGNKTYIKDPDAGIINFDYNGFGELRRQIWQKGLTEVEKYITYDYDKLGRQIGRVDTPASGSPISYTWFWDTKQLGKLSYRTGNGFNEEYFYDGFSRLSRQVVTTTGLSGGEFVYTYDDFSRPETIKYPNGFKIQRDYHAAGYQVQTRDISSGSKVLWALGDTLDARGEFNNQLWGNGVVTQTGFDNTSGRLTSIKSGHLSGSNNFANLYGDIQNLSYSYDTLGNLVTRTTARTNASGVALENMTESYTYDKLNRIKTETSSGLFGRTQTYDYDTGGLGNLVNRSDMLTDSSVNNDVGELKYEQVRNAGIHAVTSANGVNYSYDKYGNMTARGVAESIVYDTFNKPIRIAGATVTDFTYGPDHELYKEVSGTKTTYRLAGGIYEVIVDGANTTQKSYVDGVIMNNRVLNGSTQSANDTIYLHTDNLGSVDATTDALGQFVNRMSFGAWGERQKSDWKPGSPTEIFQTSNGFTGHDELDNHNLIHMGGRVYDPGLGRFLSADIFVQSPYSSQSYNRYSYASNNPLSRVDPTGYSDMGTLLEQMAYQHATSWFWLSSVNACSYTVTSTTTYTASTQQDDGTWKLNSGDDAIWSERRDYTYVGQSLVSQQQINDWSRRLTGLYTQRAELSKYGYDPQLGGLYHDIDQSINGIYYEIALANDEIGINSLVDMATPYLVGGIGLKALLGGEAKGILTPYGLAVQSQSAAALAARAEVSSGATLYRIGTTGKSQAAEAQFWSLENPLSTGYASRYGIPVGNVSNANFIEAATLKPGASFITRQAPGIGSNVGGGIEVVVPSGGVQMKWFTGMP